MAAGAAKFFELRNNISYGIIDCADVQLGIINSGRSVRIYVTDNR